MNSVSQTTGSNNVYAADSLTGATGLSPEALLAYCQQQLGGLDDEIRGSINQQNLELREREAAESAQGVLESFGDNGPQSQDDMQKCVDALNKAINSLPAGDPVAAELTSFKQSMESQYGFTEGQPGRALTPEEQKTYDNVKKSFDDSSTHAKDQKEGPGHTSGAYQDAVAPYEQIMNGTQSNWDSSKAPKNNDWKGTCTTLDNYVGDIKSNAEIQMLSLQDLVSQRQQAVSLACSMMSKEDSSLEQLSHLGQQ
jgi:hypothetical protein